jgi:hypothetical protein
MRIAPPLAVRGAGGADLGAGGAPGAEAEPAARKGVDGRAKPGHDGGTLSLRRLKRLLFRRALVRIGASDWLATQADNTGRRPFCISGLRDPAA